MDRAGGREVGVLAHLVWLLLKGLPWLWRRGSDLVPYAASIAWRDRRASRSAEAPASGGDPGDLVTLLPTRARRG
jgi:hypothetical protein